MKISCLFSRLNDTGEMNFTSWHLKLFWKLIFPAGETWEVITLLVVGVSERSLTFDLLISMVFPLVSRKPSLRGGVFT